MKILEERARRIAMKANECCSRSDGCEEAIYEISLTALQETFVEALLHPKQKEIS